MYYFVRPQALRTVVELSSRLFVCKIRGDEDRVSLWSILFRFEKSMVLSKFKNNDAAQTSNKNQINK